MISKAKIKYIRSLELKKKRNNLGVFVAEGPKVVDDLLAHFDAVMIIATSLWFRNHDNVVNNINAELVTVDDEDLRKISFLQHPQQVLAVFKQKIYNEVMNNIESKLILALDGVQDPGNLGTILRIADWFGIETVFCSDDTADVYNPKVVQATMGSIARVKVIYTDLIQLINSLPEKFPVYGTLLDGKNIYECNLNNHGLIIMGNEGKGISSSIRHLITQKLYIPRFLDKNYSAESLNVAVATAIVCSEFRRKR